MRHPLKQRSGTASKQPFRAAQTGWPAFAGHDKFRVSSLPLLFLIELVLGDLLVRALLFLLAQFLQMLWCAVCDAVGGGLCVFTCAPLRFSHMPQTYNIAHAVLIRNSDFNSDYHRIAAETRRRFRPHIERETFRDRTRTVSSKQKPGSSLKSAGRTKSVVAKFVTGLIMRKIALPRA
jgi:hypothetical protein